MNNKRKKIIAVVKLALLAAIVAGVPALLYFRYGSLLYSTYLINRFMSYLRLHRSIAAWIIIGLQVLQIIICIIPGQPIQFAASYMFGILPGYLLSVAGAVIGTLISFGLARVLGKDFLNVFFDNEKIDYYSERINSGKGLMAVLLIYLIPGVPKDLVSYAAGITNMGVRPFIIVSTLGRSPGMLGSLLFGHFFNLKNYTAIIILAAVTVILSAVCIMKRRSLLRFLERIELKDEERRGSDRQHNSGCID